MQALIKQRNHELFESCCFCWFDWFWEDIVEVVLVVFEEFNSDHDFVDGDEERVDVVHSGLLVLVPLLQGRVAIRDHMSLDSAVHGHRCAEVNQLHNGFPVLEFQHKVLWLDIIVDDPFIMHVVDRSAHLIAPG